MNKKSKLFLTMLFCCQLANILSFAYAEEKWKILNLKPQYIEGGYELCSGSERVADITWDPDSCIPGRCNIGSVNVAEKFRGLKLSTELYRAATDGCDSVYSIHVKDNFRIWQQEMLKTGDALRSVSCTPEGKSLAKLGYYPIKCDIYDKNTAVTYISSTPPRPSNCINGPLLSGPPTLNSPAVTLANVQSRSGASRATRVGSASKKILQKVALGAYLDLKGLVKGACKSGLKGVVKSGPFVVCEIAVQAGTGYAVRSAGGNENQEEGACALASIGTGAALGGCVAGPPGAAVGAGVSGGVEAGIGVCKIGYYTTSSFYNYGVCESVGSWLEEGYNPIDYWCGY